MAKACAWVEALLLKREQETAQPDSPARDQEMTCWADHYFIQAHLRGCEETLEQTQLMVAWPTSPEILQGTSTNWHRRGKE